MLRISEIKLDLDCDFNDIEVATAKALKIERKRIIAFYPFTAFFINVINHCLYSRK